MLHNETEIFEQLILRTSEYLNIKPEIIEKDYFVTIFLKKLVEKMPESIFKGGTSLSKCYTQDVRPFQLQAFPGSFRPSGP